MPGFRNADPMRESSPIPSETLATSAPTTSHKFATDLRKVSYAVRSAVAMETASLVACLEAAVSCRKLRISSTTRDCCSTLS